MVSVLDFGAKINDESIIQTEYFQKAIDACYLSGGGEIFVPRGKYIIGGIRLRSNITLRLEDGAQIFGSKNIEDYKIIYNDKIDPIPENFLPKSNILPNRIVWFNALIFVYNEKNVSIVGSENSLINGSNVFNPNGEEGYRGPHLITALGCENLTFKGYTVEDSANWSHNMWFCKNVNCEDITVLAGHDGIDFFASNDVVVRNCKLHTGDDCIAGFDNQNVLVEKCIINSSCSAFRFSGVDVVIKDCKIYGPGKYIHRNSLSFEEKQAGVNADAKNIVKYRNNMLSFFTYYCDMRLNIRKDSSNIVVKDCEISNCDRFLHFNYSGNERWQKNRPLRNITFENLNVKGIKMPINLYGDKENPVSLTIKNSTMDFSEEGCGEALIHTANFESIVLENVISNNSGQAVIKCWGECGNIKIENGNLSDNFKNSVENMQTEFSTQWF